jgi:hypothetical protein
LLNAAYRDGSVEHPYPLWIGQAIRFCVPLMLLVALTAEYALIVRVQHEGLTVARVWGLVVAGAGLLYCAGYTLATVARGPWLAYMGQVNVHVAALVIGALTACLTPLASPYRLAADSQYRLILAGQYRVNADGTPELSRFEYLQFYGTAYGRRRLQQLATLRDHPRAVLLSGAAAKVMRHDRAVPVAPRDPAQQVAAIRLFPAGRTLDPPLKAVLVGDWALIGRYPQPLDGLFVDLDADGVDEFVLLGNYKGWVYQNRAGHWQRIGRTSEPSSWHALEDDLEHGNVTAQPPHWQDLGIGGQRLRIELAD